MAKTIKVIGLTVEDVENATEVKIKRFSNHDRVYLIEKKRKSELGVITELIGVFTLSCHIEQLPGPLRSAILERIIEG